MYYKEEIITSLNTPLYNSSRYLDSSSEITNHHVYVLLMSIWIEEGRVVRQGAEDAEVIIVANAKHVHSTGQQLVWFLIPQLPLQLFGNVLEILHLRFKINHLQKSNRKSSNWLNNWRSNQIHESGQQYMPCFFTHQTRKRFIKTASAAWCKVHPINNSKLLSLEIRRN